MKNSITLVAIQSLVICGCSATFMSSSNAGNPAIRPPASVAITADHPLLQSEVLPPSATPPAPGGEGFNEGIATTKDIFPAVASASTLSTAKPPQGKPAAVNAFAPTLLDATASFNINVTITADMDPAAVPACTLIVPFSSVPCSFPRFKIAHHQLESGPLQASVYAKNDPTNAVVSSNEIPSTTLKIRQLANLRGDEAKDDVPAQFSKLVYNKKLFFTGVNAAGQSKLFAYNDLTKTLEQITNSMGPNASDHPTILGTYGNRLFFTALNSGGLSKLASFDDVAGALQQISDTAPGKNDHVTSVSEYSGALYFTSNYKTEGTSKLFRYDTETEAVTLTSNTAGSESKTDNIQGLVTLGDRLFFVANGVDAKAKLHFVNSSGKIIREGNISTENPYLLKNGNELGLLFNGKAILLTHKLLALDTAKNTHWASNTRGNPKLADEPSFATPYNDLLVFRAKDSAGFARLFSYQPTKGGIVQPLTRLQDKGDDLPSHPLSQGMVTLLGRLYFIGNTSANTSSLFEYDQATQSLRAIGPVEAPEHLINYDNKVFFTALNAQKARKLYFFDPSTGILALSSNTRANPTLGDDPKDFVIYSKKLFFTALGSKGGRKLYGLCNPILGCKP